MKKIKETIKNQIKKISAVSIHPDECVMVYHKVSIPDILKEPMDKQDTDNK